MGEEITVRLDDTVRIALDAWIARHDPPRPSPGEAIAVILAGALGSHAPSTTIPGLVTGRDIV